MNESFLGYDNGDSFESRPEEAFRKALAVLSPETNEAKRVMGEKDIYWGPKPSLEYQRGLVQAHFALVEKAALGKLGPDDHRAYIFVLKWARRVGNDEGIEAKIKDVRGFDCQFQDDRENLLKISKKAVEEVAKANVFRAAFGSLDKIEAKIIKELRPALLFQKKGKKVVVSE